MATLPHPVWALRPGPWRGAGVVERGGLENRCAGNPCTEGSNPSPSAEPVAIGRLASEAYRWRPQGPVPLLPHTRGRGALLRAAAHRRADQCRGLEQLPRLVIREPGGLRFLRADVVVERVER